MINTATTTPIEMVSPAPTVGRGKAAQANTSTGPSTTDQTGGTDHGWYLPKFGTSLRNIATHIVFSQSH
jgi:hypothetical protein